MDREANMADILKLVALGAAQVEGAFRRMEAAATNLARTLEPLHQERLDPGGCIPNPRFWEDGLTHKARGTKPRPWLDLSPGGV